MNTREFVEEIRKEVVAAAIEDTIKKLRSPPGRNVSEEKKVRSSWYNNLSTLDRELVDQTIQYAIEEVTFGFLAILDGSRSLGDGRLELFHIDRERVLINDPENIGLNEIFNAVD